jgi:hypothetical protein
MVTLIAALAFVPLVATHHGLRVHSGIGSGYTSGWQVTGPGDAAEQSVRSECAVTGADLLRRAAPPINGGTPERNLARRAINLAPSSQLVCLD